MHTNFSALQPFLGFYAGMWAVQSETGFYAMHSFPFSASLIASSRLHSLAPCTCLEASPPHPLPEARYIKMCSRGVEMPEHTLLLLLGDRTLADLA
eukprot:1141025-Pelagomonas_calceolata.AAC.3